ncbi:hypothetical protein [Jiella pelagia]|uniref:Uncharacterized protein n=1 Tax=Jiella pelagia TaxID=2986949 RepID=A0ABY7C333_9HYPH|nr:hypothetical protein [Jiella pelagia]WAP69636.1 hypothetical protein OH818_05280 [Jiella pelagia]
MERFKSDIDEDIFAVPQNPSLHCNKSLQARAWVGRLRGIPESCRAREAVVGFW